MLEPSRVWEIGFLNFCISTTVLILRRLGEHGFLVLGLFDDRVFPRVDCYQTVRQPQSHYGASLGAMVCLALALFGGKSMALMAFPAVGFFASVMWSIVVSLALNSVANNHGSFSVFSAPELWGVRLFL